MFLVGWSRVPQAPGMTVRAKIETIADIAEEYAHAHASNAVERRACFLNRLDSGLSDIPSPPQESEIVFADGRLWRVRRSAIRLLRPIRVAG